MRRLSTLYRDHGGFAGADFALITLMLVGGRHVALCYGTQIGALLKPLLGTTG